MEPIVPWLLSLPSGIHFQRLTLEWNCKEDIPLTMALVEKCSHTLESLDITCNNSRGTGYLSPHRNNSVFQPTQGRVCSTSQNQQSSKSFGSDRWGSGRSRSHSGPSRANIETFDKS